MFGIVNLATGTSPQFLRGNRLSSIGTSRSHRPLSFPCRNPNKVTVQAYAQIASRVDARKPANLYEVLRVKETASPIEIKTAYRSLAKRFHPDAATSESDGRDFIDIHNAYATLSDPMARARYDLSIGAGGRYCYSAGIRLGFAGQTRRWETDQCW